ncbi:TetR family transcriptional regulator [Miniimonas arenae]|uniref:TetR family transcriptional regulator n=1 Tax=Miniimonas arenae TaxID=676201 RepID=A0A5C5BF59_9MICO|nr:TetR/AcrR family transcriptional regulator [Miniimonas arenae]TNU76185.1 TetR family transcriptional regulator [Miniimonas arenae]
MPTLRARKKAARHDAFVDAARRLVRERGLDGVTVEDVCDVVGVSPRTFFNYFATKEDAVLGVPVDTAIGAPQTREAFAAGGPTGDLLEDCGRLVAEILAQDEEGRDELAELLELVHSEPKLLVRHLAWMETQRRALQDLITRREEVRPSGVDPVVTATTVVAMFRAAVLTWRGDATPGHHAPGDPPPDATPATEAGSAVVRCAPHHAPGVFGSPEDAVTHVLAQVRRLAGGTIHQQEAQGAP